MREEGKGRWEPPPAARKIQVYWKDWWELALSVSSAISAILATVIRPAGLARSLGMIIAVALIIASAYLFSRAQKRRQLRIQRGEQIALWEVEKQKRTAFRGLYPYREGDTLPGEQRQREARTLFTQVTDSDFTFGVVCGDVGCGKTSLLRCSLSSLLRESGHRVLYIAGLNQLSYRSGRKGKETAAKRLRRELGRMGQMIQDAASELPLVLILDHVEQLLIEHPHISQRAQIGRFFHRLIHSKPRIRILFAIRRDYLIDMQDLAPNLPEPLSSKTIFQLRNFSEEQAADVIEQCARLDDLPVRGEFAAALASDLAEGGSVRPPELQIVCTALVGKFELSKYRLSGGARGILSGYINNEVSQCANSSLGGAILRALCDFSAHAKKDPQTIAGLEDAVGEKAGLRGGRTSELIPTILAQFEVARIVVSDCDESGRREYSLTHDYLVDSISIATSDMSTRAERANQLLRYYLSGVRSGSSARIPLLRYRSIARYADPKLLASSSVKQLMRSSLRVYITAGAIVLVLLTSAGVYATKRTRRTWRGHEIGRHKPSASVNSDMVIYYPELDRLVSLYSGSEQHVGIWESKLEEKY
jgi:GTPase SAR1 family protein